MMANAMGIIFSNMHDEMLQDLTAGRTMGSVPFGGRYRLIDFVLSNLYNSGIDKVGVITKNNYQSLLDHLGSGKEWDLSHKREGLFILPPFGRSQTGVYKNRIEALCGIREFVRRSTQENIILCDCDEICNMDFSAPLDFHIANRADITVVCKKRKREKDRTVYSYTTDGSGRAVSIAINPETEDEVLTGVNIWIIRKSFLEYITSVVVPRGIDNWERGVLMAALRDYRVFCWEFTGYMGHIGSMRDYFKASRDLLDGGVRRELFYRYGHIYTKVRDEEPAKYGAEAEVVNSLVADGCVVEGRVENSILFRGVHIGKNSVIQNSIIMQSSRIDENVRLNYAIIDKDASIQSNRSLMGYGTYLLFISKGSII